MTIFHFPGMVLVLIALAFLGGMLAFSLRLLHALWGLTVAGVGHGGRLASRLGRVAARILAATRRRVRSTPSPLAGSSLRRAFLLPPWRSRPRLVVLIADPAARRVRAAQLRDALADLLSAHARPPSAALTIEIASEARRDGTAYVAYLDRCPAPGTARIRVASFAPDGGAIGVDAQHTHLADLFPFLDGNPAATFVGLPAADPSSPIVGVPSTPPILDSRRPAAVRHAGALSVVAPASVPVPHSPIDAGSPPQDTDPDIPYGDHDAPAA